MSLFLFLPRNRVKSTKLCPCVGGIRTLDRPVCPQFRERLRTGMPRAEGRPDAARRYHVGRAFLHIDLDAWPLTPLKPRAIRARLLALLRGREDPTIPFLPFQRKPDGSSRLRHFLPCQVSLTT